jgi:hypothetical protein
MRKRMKKDRERAEDEKDRNRRTGSEDDGK